MATQYLGAGTFVANSALTAFRAVVISNNRGVGLAATAGSVDGITQIDADIVEAVRIEKTGDACAQ